MMNVIRKQITKTAIFTGNPVEDAEIAKRLISAYPKVDLQSLMAIAADESQSESARIAAIYTLGFTDDNGMSRSILTAIIADPHASPDVKDYANEALASIIPHH